MNVNEFSNSPDFLPMFTFVAPINKSNSVTTNHVVCTNYVVCSNAVKWFVVTHFGSLEVHLDFFFTFFFFFCKKNPNHRAKLQVS